MAVRSQFDTVAIDGEGNALSNVNASVYNAGTTDLVTIYSTRSGGGTLSNPITTTSTGIIQFWATPGSYDIKFEDNEIPARISTRTIGWEAVSGATAGIAATQLDTADGKLIQTAGYVAATSNLSLSSSWADISGASVTFTSVLCKAIIHCVFNLECDTGTGAMFENTDIRGRLVVDGTGESKEARLRSYDPRETGIGAQNIIAGTVSQIYVVSLAASSHTLKLQGYGSSAGTDTCIAAGTGFIYQLIAQ